MGTPQREGPVPICPCRALQRARQGQAFPSSHLEVKLMVLSFSPCKVVSQKASKGLHWPHSSGHADCAALPWQGIWHELSLLLPVAETRAGCWEETKEHKEVEGKAMVHAIEDNSM